MSIITMPRNLACGRGCRIEQATFDMVSASEVTGSSQARWFGEPHWLLSLVQPPVVNETQAALWRTMLLGLQGSLNHLAAFDPSRPMPRGTLRGVPTLVSAAAQGDTQVVITGTASAAGRTLEPGDWLQLGTGLGTSQLVIVLQRVVLNAGGQGTVPIAAPLRLDLPAGTAITTEYPLGYFRRLSGRTAWQPYSRQLTTGLGIDLVEAW